LLASGSCTTGGGPPAAASPPDPLAPDPLVDDELDESTGCVEVELGVVEAGCVVLGLCAVWVFDDCDGEVCAFVLDDV
jgi:hypothetical protein